jgi:hypothetical protein
LVKKRCMLLGRVCFVCILILSGILPVAAAQKETPSYFYLPQDAPVLLREQGYLLIDLDVGGKAPSIEFVELKLSRKSKHGEKPIYSIGSEKYQVSLKDLKNGMSVMPLEAGLYQITSINAPFFELPYILDTASKPEWRFSVKADSISYAGKLVIEQERGKNFINVNFLKRFANDQQEIEQVASTFFPQVPLIMGYGNRDDFYEYLRHLISAEEAK